MAKPLHFVHPLVRVMKRAEDIVLALCGLSLLLLLTPFLAWRIHRESPGPVFYKQLRVGGLYADRSDLFWMIKFRTMYMETPKVKAKEAEDYDVDVDVRTQEDDPRITPSGKWLRKTRLDELPQVINVLKGEMSVVGPRPDLPSALTEMQAHINLYEDRTHSLRPGITGLAQVKTGYTLSVEDIKVRADYDAAYAMVMAHPWRWLCCEMRILWATVSVMFRGAGH